MIQFSISVAQKCHSFCGFFSPDKHSTLGVSLECFTLLPTLNYQANKQHSNKFQKCPSGTILKKKKSSLADIESKNFSFVSNTVPSLLQ